MTVNWQDVIHIVQVLGGGAFLGSAWKFAILPAYRKLEACRAFVKRLVSQMDKVDIIHAEIQPNGGGSLKDSVARIERDQIVSSQILRALAVALPVGTWRSDSRGLLVEVNRNAQRIVGRSSEELLGASWITWVVPDDQELFVDSWHDAVRQVREFDGTCRMLLPDGRVQKVRSRGAPIRDAKGVYLGHFGTVESVGPSQS